MGFADAYAKALSGSGKSSNTNLGGAQSILDSFKPGQYSKVNADIAARQPKVQQQQQKQQAKPKQGNSLFNKVKNDVVTFAKSAAQSSKDVGEKTLNTVGAGVAGEVGIGTAGIQAAKGDKAGATRTLVATNQEISDKLDKGKSYVTSKQAASRGGGGKSLVRDFINPTAKAAVDVGPYAMPVVAPAAEGSSLLTRAVYGGLDNAAVNTAATGASLALNKAPDSKTAEKELLTTAVTSLLLGGLMPTLHGGVKAGAEKVSTKSAKAALQTAKQNSLLDKVRGPEPVTSPVAKPVVNAIPEAELAKVPVTKPVAAPVQPEHPVTKLFNDSYKGGKQGGEEAQAADYIRQNPDKAIQSYDKRVQEKFGASNVVSGDEAKYVIPGFNSTKSASYHEPASAIAKVKYQQLLSDPATKDKPVLLMAGGSGAGKTSALKRLGLNYDNYAAVIDTNTNKLEGASSRIDQAIASGRHVEVFYVHRDPIKAFSEGVIPRGGKEGRIVPIDTHIDTHFGSHETVHALRDKYKGNPNVEFTAASNNFGHGKAAPIELDEIPKMKYTRDSIKQHLQKAVNDAHAAGQITPEEHSLYHGKSDAVGEKGHNVQGVDTQGAGSSSSKSQPERSSRASTGQAKTSRVAEPTAKTLTPTQTAHLPEIGGYTHSSHMAADYADMLRQKEQGLKGGSLLKKTDSSYSRSSEHSKFYREFYAENKKAPTKADYLEEAKRQLVAGKDEMGAGKDYQTLVDREAKPLPTPKISAPLLKTDGKTKTSKLGKGVEAKAIEAKLTKSLGDLPQYSKVNMKEQGRYAADLLANDEQKAIDIALGKEAPPAHILPEAVYTAVETKALATGDIDMIKALANSTRVGEATAMGQRIRALADRNPDNAVKAVQALQEARSKAFEAKNKITATKAVSKEVLALRKATPKPTKETFASFVESLKC